MEKSQLKAAARLGGILIGGRAGQIVRGLDLLARARETVADADNDPAKAIGELLEGVDRALEADQPPSAGSTNHVQVVLGNDGKPVQCIVNGIEVPRVQDVEMDAAAGAQFCVKVSMLGTLEVVRETDVIDDEPDLFGG